LQEHRRQRELEIPLLGKIAAGKPVEAVEQRATLSFADFVGHRDTYALEVSGDSMIEDHICDGDMILLERTSEARDGEIVVALVSGMETTLKRIHHEPGNRIRAATGRTRRYSRFTCRRRKCKYRDGFSLSSGSTDKPKSTAPR